MHMNKLEHSTPSPRHRLDEAKRLAASGSPARAYDVALAAHQTALTDDVLTAETADCLADCCLKMARYELGIGFSRIAATVWQTKGEIASLARSLSQLAEFLAAIGAPDAVATAEKALEIAEQSGVPAALAHANMTMGLALFMARALEESVPFAERAVTVSRQAGLSYPVAIVNWAEAIFLRGVARAEAGDEAELTASVARAVQLSREALAAGRRSGDGWIARLALINVAQYSMRVGDLATATAALAEFEDTPGEPTMRCAILYEISLAKIFAAQGQLDDAKTLLDACAANLRGTDYLEMKVMCYGELASVLERMGRFQESLAAHRQYHACFIQQASEGAQRLARVAAYESEARALRDAAGRAQSLAATLVRSNNELAREAERLLRTTLEDPLTGLPNRRRLEMALTELGLTGSPFACAMLDIDHFKQVNDQYSHAIGDIVLRELGAVFSRAARHDDLVVRYGGEEFALVVNTADAATARRLCERLRAGVAGYDWSRIQAGLTVTTSIGLALSTEAASAEEVLKIADARLYDAKRGGRNRVVGPRLH
jgi:diguanylate cyclase (GGDEF)-like protein